MSKSMEEVLKIAMAVSQAECRCVETRHFIWTWKDGDPVQQIGLSTEHAGRLERGCRLSTLHPVSRRGRTGRDLPDTCGLLINRNSMSAAA